MALCSAGEQKSHGTLGECEWPAAKSLLSIRPCPSHPLQRGRGVIFLSFFQDPHGTELRNLPSGVKYILTISVLTFAVISRIY